MHPFHKCLATGVLVALMPFFVGACGDDDGPADTTQDQDNAEQSSSDGDAASEEAEEEEEIEEPKEDPNDEPRADMDAGSRVDAKAGESTSDAAQPDAGRANDAGASSQCPVLPTKFAIDGCGLPTVCHVKQDGCDWQAKCGTRTLTGSGAAADATSLAGFSHPDGRVCTIKLTNGQLTGSCTGGDAGMCTFTTNANPIPTPAQAPGDCYAVPALGFTTNGCASDMACEDLVQSGCKWQTRCTFGGSTRIYGGTSVANGVKFASGNYQCWAYQREGNASLVGACSSNGQEVSQCSPRVNNGTMTLTPRTAAP